MLTLPHPQIEIAGAFDLDATPDGIFPRRLPAWTRPQVPADMHRGVRGASGVRLRLWPTTETVTVRLRSAVYHPEAAPPQLVTALRGETEVSVEVPTVGALTEDGFADPDIPFSDVTLPLPTGEGPVEIWLPPGGVTEIAGVAVEGLNDLPPEDRLRWWHYGSSISQCSGAAGPLLTWPALAARRLGVHLTSLGFGGQAMLDQFVARTLRDGDADAISLAVGINIQNGATMTARTFAPALHGFLDTIREGKPTTRILLLSPIAFPEGEDRPGPLWFDEHGGAHPQGDPAQVANGALSVGAIRTLIDQVLDVRDDPHLTFLDGRDLLGPTEAALLSDGLHPSAEGYQLLGERFAVRAEALGFPPHQLA